MKNSTLHKSLTYLIAIVWFVNGFFCKVLNLVPRHQEIVARILSEQHARMLTVLIGLSEVIMMIWILSRYKSRLNAWVQIIIIASMNLLETVLAPDLLLWGHWNIVFAGIFCMIIYYNQFILNPSNHQTPNK
ncbi:DoxX-like family protein [Sphingobacterium hungaricum]|uniref:DoxX-like family protein n=1 Tax=Sphingobacterium hungaricum TaxID=2082723 RepID=A0A928YR79_9SPHI|nr:DoxX-like family protein [Sphingobacterium hungaricum]MBE8713835.1 hypothetical protein [Sphingobacterium hungaricum]